MNKENLTQPFWSLSVAQTLKLLDATETGLTQKEAAKRLALFGENKIHQKQRVTKLRLFLRQFKNPLIVILLIGAVITAALSQFSDSAFISFAVLFNAALGYYQENKAEEALESLKQYITNFVRVYRDGADYKIATENLVPGDVIRVSQGDQIPADARLIYTNDLRVDESLLTGESLPAQKNTKPVGEKTVVGDRTSMIFNGSTVSSGFGEAIVTVTDDQTELGKIASMVFKDEDRKTPLQQKLIDFSLKASFVLFVLTIGVFIASKVSGSSTVDAFLISVAILVSAVPEGLPIVMTVILAIGVQRLAKKNGIIRKLAATETLGSTSIILTDKTGTLTQAKMSLTDISSNQAEKYFGKNEDVNKKILELALLNLDAGIENPKDAPNKWKIIGKPIEVALIQGAGQKGIQPKESRNDKKQLYYLPFNSKNKFSASIYEVPGSFFNLGSKKIYIESILGAPEVILEKSKLTEKQKKVLHQEIAKRALAGERLVAIAFRKIHAIKEVALDRPGQFEDLNFLGYFSLKDPLRPNVRKVIQEVKDAGVRVIIVTGDHAGTAKNIANEVGLPAKEDEIINGNDLDEMSDTELKKRLSTLKIVSRVSPAGKQRLVDILQKQGEIVAMNGDGINDAPAIKKADIGIAMGSGTDVTKGVADLVLLDDDFKTIIQAIKEGRRIINNIRKAIAYLISPILNEIVLIGASLLIGLPIPFNALQILWVNFFTDSFPGIALAFEDKIDPTGKKPTNLKKGIFTNEMKVIVFINGTISTILLLALYIVLLKKFDEATVKTFIFSAFATYSLFLGFSMRSLKRGIFEYNPFGNPYLVASTALGFIFTLAAIYMPLLQNLFDTVPLSFNWMLAVVGFGLLNILLIEITKLLFRTSQD